MYFASTRRNLLIVGFALAIGASVGYWLVSYPRESFVEGIRIRGSEEFVTQIEESLLLLREKSPQELALTQRYIKRIRQRSRSGMNADVNPPTLDLSAKTADFSTSWCAGSIVHDAYHSKLFDDYRTAHGEPVPESAWTGKSIELKCIEIQLRALKNIGAPEFEIEYLSGLDGSHYDLDGDGQSAWYDYWKRDW